MKRGHKQAKTPDAPLDKSWEAAIVLSLPMIKKREGFCRKPEWDYKQWSVGYGSKASGKNDYCKDEAEGERRLIKELRPHAQYVAKKFHGLDLTPEQKVALISRAYNAGDGRVNDVAAAMHRGDKKTANALMLTITKAGGEVKKGLVDRRKEEHDVFAGIIKFGKNVLLAAAKAVGWVINGIGKIAGAVFNPHASHDVAYAAHGHHGNGAPTYDVRYVQYQPSPGKHLQPSEPTRYSNINMHTQHGPSAHSHDTAQRGWANYAKPSRGA